MRGDVTTAGNVNSRTILSKLGKIVRSYLNSRHFTKKDLQEIVHIVDMDGAYIPDTAVVEDPTAKKPVYSLTEIRTADLYGIRKRNGQKRGCLDKISSTPTLCGIPYQAYYMSCNLDHVLHGKPNATDEEKEHDSFRFSEKYRFDIDGFMKFFLASDFSVGGSYLESWSFIKKDKHSLERHTNLGICLERAVHEQVGPGKENVQH